MAEYVGSTIDTKYREEMLMAYEKLAALISGIVDPQPNVVSIRGGQR